LVTGSHIIYPGINTGVMLLLLAVHPRRTSNAQSKTEYKS